MLCIHLVYFSLLPPMSMKPRYSLGWRTQTVSLLFPLWYVLVVKYTLCVNMCFLPSSRVVQWVLQVPRYSGSRLPSRSLPSVAYSYMQADYTNSCSKAGRWLTQIVHGCSTRGISDNTFSWSTAKWLANDYSIKSAGRLASAYSCSSTVRQVNQF